LRLAEKNCDEFVGFLLKIGKERTTDNPRFRQQFQPIERFIRFLDANTDFRGKVGLRPSTSRLAVVCADACSRPKNLFAEHVGGRRPREASNHADDSESEIRRPSS